jgi:hypothetical protein
MIHPMYSIWTLMVAAFSMMFLYPYFKARLNRALTGERDLTRIRLYKGMKLRLQLPDPGKAVLMEAPAPFDFSIASQTISAASCPPPTKYGKWWFREHYSYSVDLSGQHQITPPAEQFITVLFPDGQTRGQLVSPWWFTMQYVVASGIVLWVVGFGILLYLVR